MAAPGREEGGNALALLAPLSSWLVAGLALPLAVVALLSVQEAVDPFAPLALAPSAARFREVLGDAYYLRILLDTALLGLAVAGATAVLAYPTALWLVRLPARLRPFGVALVLVPLLTNVVVRSLGVMLLLAPDGLVAGAFRALGLPAPRLQFTWFAVGLSLVQVFLPYMVMSLHASLRSVDPRAEEAAATLGAGPVHRFLSVTLPLSLDGLRGGLLVVFLLASTAYVSASLLGGKKVWVAGMLVYEEALQLLNQPKAAAIAVLMLAMSVAGTLLIGRLGQAAPDAAPKAAPIAGRTALGLPAPPPALARGAWAAAEAVGPWVARALLALALGLLLFPLGLVAVSSVNDSPQATVAAFLGFTWKWYALALENERYLDALWLSLRLALASSAAALALALPAAFALERHRVPGREGVATLLMLPAALPGIAIALGMLRLLQWFVEIPAFLGLMAVHVVLIAPFALAVLRASVARLDPALDEAAAGLGAGPVRRFGLVLLPQLAPGLAAAGIVGFLVSFGEVTVTAFLATARAQTLPVRIYAEAGFSLENTVNAVSTLIILATAALLFAANRYVRLDRVWHR
jgi:putative spermidine/putrescine transport system permease protein